MTVDPRTALDRLTAALERHLEAAATRHGDDDPNVLAAYQDVADAFDVYDDALMETYGEVTPLEVYGDEDDEDDEDQDEDSDDDEGFEVDNHDDEDGDSDGVYLGLDDSEFDTAPPNATEDRT